MRMPAPSRSPITHRRRPMTGVSAMACPPHCALETQETLRPAGCQSAQLTVSPREAPGRVLASHASKSRPAEQLPLEGVARPNQRAHDLDDDERDESAEQHVAEVVADEGQPQQACAEAEGERGDDSGTTPGRGQHARRGDHPESGRRLAGDERAVFLAGAVVVIPRPEGARSVEVLGLDRAGTMPMILEAKIDDEAR